MYLQTKEKTNSIDYKNITIEEILANIEDIDWDKVPIKLLFKKNIMKLWSNFPSIQVVVIKKLPSVEDTNHELFNSLKESLENGFDIHWGNDFLLRWFILCDYTEVLELLLEKGANANLDTDILP